MRGAVGQLASLPAGRRGRVGLFMGLDRAGKSFAAKTLTTAAQRDVLVVSLRRIVTKYIGETEKNLARVFSEAERAGAMLLFDEAGALFGNRTDVKDSHDRYANRVITYLLRRALAFAGIAILATSRKPTIPQSILQRFRVVYPPRA